jgi:hypothetical protein
MESKLKIFIFIMGFFAYISFALNADAANVGYDSIGGNTSNGIYNRINFSRITVPSGGGASITTGSLYISGGSSQSDVYLVVYSGTTTPSTLLGVSNGVTIAASQASGWVNFSFSSPFTITDGQSLWLGFYVDGPGTSAVAGGATTVYTTSAVGDWVSSSARFVNDGDAPVPSSLGSTTTYSGTVAYSEYISDGYGPNGTGSNGSIQTYTVPSTGAYQIMAKGAQGGGNSALGTTGGLGASMQGNFYLTAGEVINIMVGQAGGDGHGGGGGGGSFVVKDSGDIPLIVAGGGGGGHSQNGNNATTSNDGTTDGGIGVSYGTGGGGLVGNGTVGGSAGGTGITASSSYINGGTGGASNTGGTAKGGYGGGGGAHTSCGGSCGAGGGGGYNGGDVTPNYGNAGGSYNNGVSQVNTAGANSGDGFVSISYIGTTAGPVVSSPSVSSITSSGAVLGANVISAGGGTISGRGICWSTSGNPAIGSSTCISTSGTTGVYTISVGGMSPGTLIHYRGYATNSSGTTYTEDDSFTTVASSPPTVSTPTKSSITSSGATLGGTVTSAGTASITSRGVCVGTSSNPTISNLCFATAGTTGPFTVSATELQNNTLYHYRAYATNSVGTGYSTDDTFTTLNVAPTSVTATAYSDLLSYQITLNGSLNPNSSPARAHFRYYTSAPNCTQDSGGVRVPSSSLADTVVGSDSSVHTFSYTTSVAVPLIRQTNYWYCAYGDNDAAPGSTSTSTAAGYISFTTPDGPASPCDPPTSGSINVSKTCIFPGTIDGVDAGGSGTGNTAGIILKAGGIVTFLPGQRLAAGAMAFQGGGVAYGNGDGGTIKGGVWVKDADGDGYVDYPVVTKVSAAQPTGFIRRNYIQTLPAYSGSSFNYATKVYNASASVLDCDGTNQYIYRNVTNLVKDADNDGYKTSTTAATHCVGASATINGRTYYNDGSGPN